jgi:hypothetical protein
VTWAGAVAQLKTNVTTATTDIGGDWLVRHGEPDALVQDTLALWPTGSQPSRTGGNSYTKVNIERGVQVTGYLRGSIRIGEIDDALEARLVDLEEKLFTRIWADADLGGNSIGLAIDGSTYGWVEIGGNAATPGQIARTVSFVVWVDLPEVATISL